MLDRSEGIPVKGQWLPYAAAFLCLGCAAAATWLVLTRPRALEVTPSELGSGPGGSPELDGKYGRLLVRLNDSPHVHLDLDDAYYTFYSTSSVDSDFYVRVNAGLGLELPRNGCLLYGRVRVEQVRNRPRFVLDTVDTGVSRFRTIAAAGLFTASITVLGVGVFCRLRKRGIWLE